MRSEINQASDVIRSVAKSLLPPCLLPEAALSPGQFISKILNIYENACLQIIMDSVLNDTSRVVVPVASLFDGAIFTRTADMATIRRVVDTAVSRVKDLLNIEIAIRLRDL